VTLTKPTWRTTFDSLLTAAMAGLIVWLGWTMYGGATEPPPVARLEIPTEPVTVEGAYLRGDRSAPVAAVVYVDYACSACRMFERDTLPVLLRDYVDTGRLLLAVRPFPLPYRGGAAIDEAALTRCAGRHGKFWEAHDTLFANAGASGLDQIEAVGAAAGLETDALAACIPDERDHVRRTVEEARALGVSGTPAFLIGQLDSTGRVTVQVAHQGVSRGSQWFIDLLCENDEEVVEFWCDSGSGYLRFGCCLPHLD